MKGKGARADDKTAYILITATAIEATMAIAVVVCRPSGPSGTSLCSYGMPT